MFRKWSVRKQVLAIFAFFVGGVLRLSRFNMTGAVEEGGVKYHLGLQVYWSQIIVVFTFPVWHWWGASTRYLAAAVLLVTSVFMVRNLHFRKPVAYVRLTILILLVAAGYLYLHLTGSLAP